MTPKSSVLTPPMMAQSPGDQITTYRTGFSGHIDEPMEIMLGALLGVLIGFLGGTMLSAIMRVVRIDQLESSRMRSGWGAYGAAAGSIGMAIWKAID